MRPCARKHIAEIVQEPWRLLAQTLPVFRPLPPERADRARLRKERQELEMMIANGEQVDPELVLSLRKEEAAKEHEEKQMEKKATEKKEVIPG